MKLSEDEIKELKELKVELIGIIDEFWDECILMGELKTLKSFTHNINLAVQQVHKDRLGRK